ncbi:MAG: MerR family transcriptional regulator [Eggerthellaceae bacterium]
MEYSVNALTKLSGASARTLRYYDEIGLLKPSRIAQSGYRMYGPQEVDRLQQILFYRELGFPLKDIQALLEDPDFDKLRAFENHLQALEAKRSRLDALIANVNKSISALKGDAKMTDKEKFQGFGEKLVAENEKHYGAEARERYGDGEVDAANKHISGMTQEQFEASEELRMQLESTLQQAFEQGDPASELAQKACELHKQWLCVFYPKYTKAYHKGLVEMYVMDDRFRANYDKLGEGCTEFLRDAVNIFCAE